MPMKQSSADLVGSHGVGRRVSSFGAAVSNYILIAPAYTALGLFIVLPLIAAVWFGFFQFTVTGERVWVGGDNYVAAVTDPLTWHAVRISFQFTAMCVVFGTAVTIAIALLLNPMPKRIRDFLRTTLYLPLVVPIAAVAVIWKWLYNYAFGLINYLTELVGLGRFDWLGSPDLALPSMTFMVLATSLGANILIVLAAMDTVPAEYVEAAKLDGAGNASIFFRVVLPLIRPALLYVIVVQTITSFQLFAPFVLMTKGGPVRSTTTLGYYIYQTAFEQFDFGKASALSVLMILIISVLALVEFRLLRRNVDV